MPSGPQAVSSRRHQRPSLPSKEVIAVAKRNLVNLDLEEAKLKRILKDIEKKKKEADGILKRDLPAAKATVYGYLEKLASLGVAEDCKATILHVAHTCGEKGVRLPILRKLALDQVSLDNARNELGSEPYDVIEDGTTIKKTGVGYLVEKNDGNSIVVFITEAGNTAFESTQA
jgi:hypothetical protein